MRELGVEVELFTFPLGAGAYLPGARRLRRLLEQRELRRRPRPLRALRLGRAARRGRPLVVTFHGTDVRHRLVGAALRRLARRLDLVAGASRSPSSRRAAARAAAAGGLAAVLPCGVDIERFTPDPARRGAARARARPRRPLPPLPGRPRAGGQAPRPRRRGRRGSPAPSCSPRARSIPSGCPLWVNAASAVLVTSENEGFGLAALEALACRRAGALDAGRRRAVRPRGRRRLPRRRRSTPRTGRAAARSHLDAGDARAGDGLGRPGFLLGTHGRARDRRLRRARAATP